MSGINVKPSAASGAVPVKTDVVGSDNYQVVKLGFGPDASATHVKDEDAYRWPVGGSQIGAVNETAPVSDTASTGLNGRLQRIAQRLTSVIATLAAGIPSTALEGLLTASVAIAGTDSAAVDLTGVRNFGIFVPSTFDGTTISFKAAPTLAGTYSPVRDVTGTLVSIPVTAGTYIDVPGELMAVRFLKIVTGTAQATTTTDFQIATRS